MSDSTEHKKHEKKEFALSNLALNNKTSILILTFIIAFGGLFSYINMSKELFPEIVQPQVYVRTVYPGNSPLDMENLITRPLEKEIKPVEGIVEINSTSVQDNSAIVVEFKTDVDIDKALQDVKDAVDEAKSELPDDLDMDPMVMEMDLSQLPIMNVNISGDYSVDDLKDYAEYLQEKLEVISELSEVDLRGAVEREIYINADVHKMQMVQVSFYDIEQAMQRENVAISGGDILIEDYRRSLRIIGEYDNVEQIRNTIVKHDHGNIIYLRDIADVEDSYKERSSFSRLDGDPVVTLDVKKKSGENLLEATDQILAVIAKAKRDKLPDDLNITITNDQSEQVRSQLTNLENNIVSGVILVVLVLLFFLGLRNALFVGIAIPLSMMMSFMILGLMGITINMVVLFALILALGMLVDNGIVVIENIYRQYEQGKNALQAARDGVGEIAVPIISSTATTLAAFFPLLFWDSVMGEFMKFLPITLIIVLGSSLFVGLLINPVVASIFIKKPNEERQFSLKRFLIVNGIIAAVSIIFYAVGIFAMGTLFAIIFILNVTYIIALKPASHWFRHVFLVKVEELYLKTVTSALRGWNPYIYLGGTAALLVASIIFLGFRQPDIVFFPDNQPKYINIFVETPIGTDITRTNKVVKNMEQQLDTILQPYDEVVKSVVAIVGEGSSDPMDGGGPAQGETPNKARITVQFVEFEKRGGVSTSKIMKEVTRKLIKEPGVIVTVKKNREGPPVGNPINIEIIGEEFTTLLNLSDKVISEIQSHNIPGIEKLKIDLDVGKPELMIQIDRDKARRFGVSTGQIGSTIRTALFGKEVSKYKEGEDEYPMVVKLKDEYRYDLSSLMNQKITFRDQSTGKIVQVPISALADVKYSTSYGSVKRKDLDRVVTVFSNVLEGYNDTEINEQLKVILADFPLPEGYSLKFTGKQQEQQESMDFLQKAFMIAIALITLILVSQFNSAIKPFIIILSVLFSTIGVFLGLAIFKMDIVVMMTGIGIVSLAGIVVNNAIVLIDYIDLKRKWKREELGYEDGETLPLPIAIECIIEGGNTRLRPVLLTAITTILGLIPLAIGMNINFQTLLSQLDPQIYFGGDNVAFWGPMAWTVIFGLTFATFLTLVIVPVMYLIFEKMKLAFVKEVGDVDAVAEEGE